MHFLSYVLVYLALVKWTLAACGPRDYETFVGGYPQMHSVVSISFDTNPQTLDMIVGGTVMIEKPPL